jgi:site-specific DNA recombinase
VTQIRGAVAEYERTLIADRMRRGRQAKLRSGQLLPWTRAPYGYRLHPERPRDPAAVGVDLVAAVVVQELFAAYAAGGVTLHTLAAQLTARGVPTPTGKPIWRPTTIRGLLTNPASKGQAASGRLRTAPARRRKSALEPIGKGVSTTAHPPQEWITVPVPALVATTQFDLVQRRLAANQQSARRSTIHPYLLGGLVSCGVCRLSCTGVTRTATDTRYRYYRCLGKQARVSSGRSSCCPARFIPATQLDELVWVDLCAVLQQPELVTQALERAHSGAWVPQELRRRQASLRQVRASVTRQRQRLLEAYLAEAIDLACFQRQDRGLAVQEADLLAREREVAAQGERLVQVSAIAHSMTQVLQQLRVGLGQASFHQRRQLVELLIDRVVVTDGHVEIRYVIPTTDHSTKTRFCHLRTDYFQVEPAHMGPPGQVQVELAGAGPPQPQPVCSSEAARRPGAGDGPRCGGQVLLKCRTVVAPSPEPHGGSQARIIRPDAWHETSASSHTRGMTTWSGGRGELHPERAEKGNDCCRKRGRWLALGAIPRLWFGVASTRREGSSMGTKTITMHVSDMDEQEIAAGQAYQLTIRHPDGSTQQLDISAQNYKGLKLEGLGKMAKKRGRKPGSGTAKAASGTTGTRRRRRRSANGDAKPAAP